MPSLWTDEDHGAHSWIAAGPHAAAAPRASAPQDDEPAAAPGLWARPAAPAAACAAAAIAGALIEVLR